MTNNNFLLLSSFCQKDFRKTKTFFFKVIWYTLNSLSSERKHGKIKCGYILSHQSLLYCFFEIDIIHEGSNCHWSTKEIQILHASD